VIDAYHRLFRIEPSFRMSKHDLQARLIYAHHRDSIEEHLTIVFAGRWIQQTTISSSGSSSRRLGRTASSRSGPARTPSPPPTHYPTTSATASTPSTKPEGAH